MVCRYTLCYVTQTIQSNYSEEVTFDLLQEQTRKDSESGFHIGDEIHSRCPFFFLFQNIKALKNV